MKFVWTEIPHFIADAGGTENHTIERARELMRRGIEVEIILLSAVPYDPGFNDISYGFITAIEELSSMDDSIIYIARGHDIPTLHPSFVFLHFPLSAKDGDDEGFRRAMLRSSLITNSLYSREQWSKALDIPAEDIAVVYPFAHPAFASVERTERENICRILYPNRISAEKGIFIALEAVYYLKEHGNFKLTIIGAGNQTTLGHEVEAWLIASPFVRYIKPVATRDDMAKMYASADIVIVPSRADNWKEPFGMTSVEGQHSGCRVIASDSGGLKETDCGLLDLVPAGNALALAEKIIELSELDAPSADERAAASKCFTLAATVDSFLAVING